MPWRNHAHGSKHHHFRHPNTWHSRVNPCRLRGAHDRRPGRQWRGCSLLLAQHSLLRLIQSGVQGSACRRFGESTTGRSYYYRQSRKACRKPGGLCCPNRSGHKPSQASNSRLISSRSPLSRCSTPAVAVLHFPVMGAVSARTPLPPHADPMRRTQPERHETPVPVRPDAVNVRFHGVRQRAELRGSCATEPLCGRRRARTAAAPRPERGERAAGLRSTRRAVDSAPSHGAC
jgi:hypothetical protein